MSAPIKQSSFSGGEITPLLYGQVDHIKYKTGAKTLRNVISLRHGGATNRPGTEYVDTTLNGGNPVRLIHFIFNETGTGQSYVLEFGNQYIAFLQNGGRVIGTVPATIPAYSATTSYNLYQVAVSFGFNYISLTNNNIGQSVHNATYWAYMSDWNNSVAYTVGEYVRAFNGVTATGSYYLCLQNNTNVNPLTTQSPYWVLVASNYQPYTISSPYLQADLQSLKYAESGDIVTIVHPNYAPMELQRIGAINWQLVPVQIAPQINPVGAYINVSGGNSANPYQIYAVTAINSITGEESFPTYSTGFSPAGAADIDHNVAVSWYGATGASYYRVYKSLGSTADAFGYIATVPSTTYSDFGATPDFTNSPPIYYNPFIAPGTPQINFIQFGYAEGTAVTMAYAVTAIVGGVESSPVYIYTNVPSSYLQQLSWGTVVNATEYKVYKNNSAGGSVYGLVKTIIAITTTWVDDLTSPNNSYQPPASSTIYNPSVIGYAQQRRYFAATTANQIGFWGSQTGLYSNFNTHANPVDSDSIIGTLAGEEVNQIQQILELKFMIALTTGAEIYLQGAGNGVISPSAINASIQSQYGCGTLKPLKVGDLLLFTQALGSYIRDLSFDFAIDGYRGNDISIFSSHLFENYQIVDWAYQKTPDSIVWAVRSDGTLLSCTYVREQMVLAWTRHDFTNGFVENVCAIPENGEYALYLSIRRVINGVTVRYIERLSSRLWTDSINATYLDCFQSYNGINTSATTMVLSAAGAFDQTGAAYTQQLTLTSSVIYFTPNMVGDQIFLSDAAFVASAGAPVNSVNAGTQVRCTILAYTSATQVTVSPNRAVPIDLQGVPVTTWARAVQTVSGLTNLAGQKVSVYADRFVVGSPLNQNISTVYTVPSNGILTLDKWYSVIHVGLPIVSDIQTLPIENTFGEALTGRRKRQYVLRVSLYKTRGFFAGSGDPDVNRDNTLNNPLFQLFEYKSGGGRQTYDEAPELTTGQGWTIEDTRWDYYGYIFIRNVDPTPLTVLMVVPGGDNPSPAPYYTQV